MTSLIKGLVKLTLERLLSQMILLYNVQYAEKAIKLSEIHFLGKGLL